MAATKRKKTKISLKAWILIAVFVVAAAIALLLFLPGGSHKPLESYPFAVHFVDVDQGDGIVIFCDETTLVIDGGEAEKSDRVISLLKENDIKTVDCYIATHPHADHIGAAADIISGFFVKNVMMTQFSELNTPTSVPYEKMMTAIRDKKSEIIYAKGGDSFDFGLVHLDVFAPISETSDYNDMSLVVKLTYKGVSFLFTGDAGTTVENQMMGAEYDLHATVLKVGHHGSNSSTGEVFLQKVDPAVAVISCGYQNDYGHPDAEVLQRLKKENVTVYRTDSQGTISLYSDGRRIITENKPEA